MTKMQQIAQQLQQMDESTQMLAELFHVLRCVDDGSAASMLMQIRGGEPPETILESFRPEVVQQKRS